MAERPGSPPEQESLEAMDASLGAMMVRLREILAAPLTESGFVEVTAIYDNVAYIFLYLESNSSHVDYGKIAHWKSDFHENMELSATLLDSLEGLRCSDHDLEESRIAYIAHLSGKDTGGTAEDESARELLDYASEIVAAVQSDKLALLRRLGAAEGGGNPDTAFYRLVSATENPGTRDKLHQAMTAARDARLGPLVGTIDRMVTGQMRAARAQGHPGTLHRTLSRCGISEKEAAVLVEGYLVRALDAELLLGDEIRSELGPVDAPMNHFGHYVRRLQSGRRVPLFPLHECLDFAFAVARRTLGLIVEHTDDPDPHVLTVSVRRASAPDEIVGHINFDLWHSEHKTTAANHTKGIRNRTQWKHIVQRPVAHVSCRFRRDAQGREHITFQNVHSLFHEFGHALNHLLIRRRLPTRSGLDYLPLERLEDLSMWFEKWIYHPGLNDYLTLAGDGPDGLELCRRIKSLEYRRSHVDRAVTAALDFTVHRDGVGLAEAFAGLDERHGISRSCSLGDFPAYFTQPMFQANPGAYFAYLWGASFSAAAFLPFFERPFDSLEPGPDPEDAFRGCFDIDAPSALPDLDPVFRFYETTSSTRV